MTLNLQTPFPTFGGSTGGWLRAAEVEEKYAITPRSTLLSDEFCTKSGKVPTRKLSYGDYYELRMTSDQ